MGRRKIGMELIKNERCRNLTYQKRKKGLEKKAEELSILCEVKLCMIIYGDKEQEEPATAWPEKDTVQRLIELYGGRSDDDRRLRTHDLSFYFRELARKVEMESTKLRKMNHEAKYPTWDQFYDNLSTDQLKQTAASLDAKIDLIKQRMEYLKGTQRMSLEEMHSMSYHGKQAAAAAATIPHQPCLMQSLVRKSSLQLEIIAQQQQPLVPATMNFAEMMNTHHVGTLNNNNNVENQLGMQGMMMMRDENMLFDHHQYPPHQPMCYFVPVVTPTNYFHHHQYPMLQTHAASASYQMHASQRGEYYEMPNDHFHLPNNNTTMK